MHALDRVLRFRRLEEQQARRELERASQRLRLATAACEQQAAAVSEQRASLARSWATAAFDAEGNLRDREREPDGEGSARESLLEEAALEFSGWDRTQLEHICAVEKQRIEPLLARYIECRRSLRQMEMLVQQHAERARVEEERRTQADTDDWFVGRSLFRARRERRIASE